MKKTLKLNSYYFERINITLPQFPGKGGGFSAKPSLGKLSLYHHKKKLNLCAFRWQIMVEPKKKIDKKDFNIFVSIVGLFESPYSFHKDIDRDIFRNGQPILYEIVKNHLDKIVSNSLLKTKTLPPISFKKLTQ
jgi:preprotein translocase subunit SecB